MVAESLTAIADEGMLICLCGEIVTVASELSLGCFLRTFAGLKERIPGKPGAAPIGLEGTGGLFCAPSA